MWQLADSNEKLNSICVCPCLWVFMSGSSLYVHVQPPICQLILLFNLLYGSPRPDNALYSLVKLHSNYAEFIRRLYVQK